MSSLRVATGVTGQAEPAGTSGGFNGRASKARASGDAVGFVAEPAGGDDGGASAAMPHPASSATRAKAPARRVIIIDTTPRGHGFPAGVAGAIERKGWRP